MIDGIRSFMNTGLGTLLTAQSQQSQKLEQAQAAARLAKQQEVKFKDNPAVEIRLSPQAQALMKAFEERKAALAANGEEASGQVINLADEFPYAGQEKRGEVTRPAVSVALDRMLAQYGTPDYSAENQEKLDSLFLQLQQELGPIREFNKMQEASQNQVVDENTGYKSSLAKMNEQGAEESAEVSQQHPALEGADGLTSMERIKSAILYSELDRILGGAGVYFGGDQVISQLDTTTQERVTEAKRDLTKIITGSANGPSLTPGQEARVDEIYREISRIQTQAEDRNASNRKQAVRNLIDSSANHSRVIDAGNASLGG
ncbi:hypothetical protein [Curvivirga aplysinae]|uniref:hypothetical protein n=1 Tax=Curvivirga aplysinae TaxID=2529852 RepID=UPI0012BD1E75|nr:hypothetical protein [Curvivirga aplysinae]MTI10358.1 hypothetical protein [Curvivirga aplysinae]